MNKRTVVAALAAVLSLSAVLAPGVTSSAGAATRTSPVGANNWSCKPSAAHRVPVILVHGTFGDQVTLNDKLSPYLASKGYCVFALNYGNYGTRSVSESAGELKVFVNKVLAATGASKVSFVGHSQGGTMPRYYIKYLGGASKVDDLIGFAPGNHGTAQSTLLRLLPRGISCQACADLVSGSWFLRWLNFGDESPGSVSYTNIVTKVDAVVTPYTSGYLAAASNVSNIRIQDACPTNKTDHVNVPRDPAFIRFAVDALSHSGPANVAYRPKCTW